MHPLGAKPPEPGSLHEWNAAMAVLAVDLSDLQHGCWQADRCVIDEKCPFVTDCHVVETGDQIPPLAVAGSCDD